MFKEILKQAPNLSDLYERRLISKNEILEKLDSGGYNSFVNKVTFVENTEEDEDDGLNNNNSQFVEKEDGSGQ